MPIQQPQPPLLALDAVRARLSPDSEPPLGKAFMSGTGGADPRLSDRAWLSYPHAFLWMDEEGASYTIEPYAWQFIHGSPEQPVSYEAPDQFGDGEGSENPGRAVATVHGARLRQTVEAVMRAMVEYTHHETTYTLMVLHLRTIAFRAVILRADDDEASIAIPIEPVPPEFQGQAAWPLPEFVAVLRRKLSKRGGGALGGGPRL